MRGGVRGVRETRGVDDGRGRASRDDDDDDDDDERVGVRTGEWTRAIGRPARRTRARAKTQVAREIGGGGGDARTVFGGFRLGGARVDVDVDARTAQSKSTKNRPGIAAAAADFSRHLCLRSSARSTSRASNRACPLPGSNPNALVVVVVVVVVPGRASSPIVHTARLTNASHASAHASASPCVSNRSASALLAAFLANRARRALGPARKSSHHDLHPSSKSSRTTSADSASRRARREEDETVVVVVGGMAAVRARARVTRVMIDFMINR